MREWKDKKGSEQKVGGTSPASPSFSPSLELLELHSHKDGHNYWPSVPSSPEPAQTPHRKTELVHPSTTTNRTVFCPATREEEIAFGKYQLLPRAGGSFAGRNTPKTASNFIF